MSVTDKRAAAIAAVQANVIDLDQLRAAGLGHAAVVHRLQSGRMQRLHRRVYLLGAAPPSTAARYWAAVLACRPRALISHRSAAAVWGMLPEEEGDVHVTVLARNPRTRPGIVVHRTRTMVRADLRHRDGLPVTSPARTLADLARSDPGRTAERALSEARVLKVVTDGALAKAAVRSPQLRALLTDGPAITRSEAERRLLELVARAGLPRPRTNAKLHGFMVDFLWTEQRLIIEVDGFRFHGHRGAFERDRMRDQVLIAHGYHVIRITWRQLTEEPLAVLARIAQALVHRAA